MMLYNGKQSRYFNNDATIEEETVHKVYVNEALQNEIKNATCAGLKVPYAIIYGFVDQNGKKKLLRKNSIILTEKGFDKYIVKHKQAVLAVFNKNYINHS